MRHLALVTGAASGLGAATAARLAADGHRVIMADRDGARCLRLAGELAIPPDRVLSLDVSEEMPVVAGFALAEERHGPVTALVCCAGLSANTTDHRPAIADTPLDDWVRTEAVNSRGTFLCVREFFRHRRCRPADGGRVVLVASTAGQRPARATGAAYSASKGAVLALMRSAALEGAEFGIAVNAVAPGPFDTPAFHAVTPPEIAKRQIAESLLGRIGQPEEFAGLVAYLLSAEASYITGATFDINGGARMA